MAAEQEAHDRIDGWAAENTFTMNAFELRQSPAKRKRVRSHLKATQHLPPPPSLLTPPPYLEVEERLPRLHLGQDLGVDHADGVQEAVRRGSQ